MCCVVLCCVVVLLCGVMFCWCVFGVGLVWFSVGVFRYLFIVFSCPLRVDAFRFVCVSFCFVLVRFVSFRAVVCRFV